MRKKLYSSLALLIALITGCGDDGDSGGGVTGALYKSTVADITMYLVKKPDHFLIYRK